MPVGLRSVLLRRFGLALALFVLTCVPVLAQNLVTVQDIVVEGNQNISKEAILAAMKTKVGEPLSQTQVLEDENAIRDLGYFAEVSIVSRQPTDNEASLLVQVKENPVVREIAVRGNTAISTEKITETVVAIQPLGEIYNNRNARRIRDAVSQLYSDAGYFVTFSGLGPDEAVPGALRVDIIESRVNKITINGLTRTRESVIRRIMKTKPGQAYSPARWRRDIEELYYTYWFEDIENREAQAEGPGLFDLTLDVKEARTGQVSAGVALDPQSRLLGTLSYNDSNFRGRGENVGVFLSQATSGGGPSVELAYGNRFIDDIDTSMNVRLFSRVSYNFTGTGSQPFDNSSDQFLERRTGASLAFARPLGGPYRGTVGVSGQRIDTLSEGNREDVEYIQQDGDLVTFQFGLDRDMRRPTVEPFTGDLVRVLIEPGFSNITKIGGNVAEDTDLLGKNTFVRSTLDVRKYWSLSKVAEDQPIDTPRRVIAFRSVLAMISGDVPFFEQLFVGGAQSLRGYPNQRFWGNRSFLSTVEYRHPIQKSFSLIGFVDYGGAWGGYGRLRDYEQSSSANLKLGYGLGVAFRTPLGPIRIDFGFNQDGGQRTHLSFGTSF